MLDVPSGAPAAPLEPAAEAPVARPRRIARTLGFFLGALLVGALARVASGGFVSAWQRRNHRRAAHPVGGSGTRGTAPGGPTMLGDPDAPDVLAMPGEPDSAATPDEPRAAEPTPPRRVHLHRIRTGVSMCLDAALVGALGLAVFVGYGLVDNRWYHVLAVGGGSMAPALEPGDLIVLARPPQVLEPGMILTLEIDGQVVTHRVVDVHDDGTFVTRGDANSVDDRYSHDQVRVVGQVLFRIPLLGSVLTLFDGPRQPASAAWFAGSAAVSGRAEAAAATTSVLDEEAVDLGTSSDPEAAPDPEPPAADVLSPVSGPPYTGAPPGP